MSAFNFVFVDQVLPRSNARLRSLLIDIGRKKPTFELREQVINEVPPVAVLPAGRPDRRRHRAAPGYHDLRRRRGASRRIIYADSGLMAYAEGQTDLSLRLFDGSSTSTARPSPLGLPADLLQGQRHPGQERLRRAGSGTRGEAVRGDREMSTCEMLSVIQEAARDAARGATGTATDLLRGRPAEPAGPAPARSAARPAPPEVRCAAGTAAGSSRLQTARPSQDG